MKQGTTPQALAFLDLLDSYDAKDRIIWKAWAWSGATPEAASRGYTTWCYVDENTSQQMYDDTMANADMIAVPHTFSDAAILQAVSDANGKPVSVWEVHRRGDVERFSGLGVQGMMSSAWRYVTSNAPIVTRDTFSQGVRAPGDHGRYNSPDWMPEWGTEGDIIFSYPSEIQSYMLGSLSPLENADGTYRLSVDLMWDVLPTATLHSDIVFGKDSDDPFGFASTTNSPGYHVILRANGELGLYRHTTGSGSGTSLGSVSTGTVTAGTWNRIWIDVTPTSITVSRRDPDDDTIVGTEVTSSDTTHRGGYVHLAKGSSTTPVHFRNVVVS